MTSSQEQISEVVQPPSGTIPLSEITDRFENELRSGSSSDPPELKRRADEPIQDTDMNHEQEQRDGNGENGDGKDGDKPSNYRTRRCIRWAQGNCHLGEACTFLHSGEVGTHFPCRNFLNGYCPRGRLCDFKHDYSMLPPFGAPPMMPFHPGVVIPPLTKKSSAPCRHFEKGYCSLGIACGFQHTPGAAAATNLPANAKTTQCRHFEKGFCNLGENCGFAHGEKEGSFKPTTSPHGTQGTTATSNICRHYERGFCRLGQTCGFQHPGYVPPGPNGISSFDGFQGSRVPYTQGPDSNPYVNPYTQPTASFYQPYSPYATPTLPPRQLISSLPGSPRRPGTEVCRHWAKGYCQMDRKCGFLHPAS